MVLGLNYGWFSTKFGLTRTGSRAELKQLTGFRSRFCMTPDPGSKTKPRLGGG